MLLVAKEGIVCFILCFGFQSGSNDPLPTQDYCARYQRIIGTKKELSALKGVPRAIRDRIQGNDLDYLCQCKGWKDEACKK